MMISQPAPSVLIIDDNEANRYTMSRYLSRSGWQVWQAANGQDGLELAQRGPNVIIIDINLPDQSGWDVLRRLREDPQLAMRPPPSVIIMTAVRPHDKRIAEFHPDAVLLKPFPIDALLRLSERVLTKQPAAREEGEDG